nr:Hpt domain-containing protein [Pseudomonadota bacterium]
MDDDDDLIYEFLAESNDSLDQLDNALVALENDPGNRERLDSIFRTIHTIKGTCGFLKFSRLERLTHAGESLLSRLRDGQIALNRERADALLAMVDAVRAMLDAIAASGSDGDDPRQELTDTLTRLQQDAAPPAASRPAARRRSAGDLLVERGRVSREAVEEALELQDRGDPRHLGEILVDRGLITPQDVVDVLQMQQPSPVLSVRVDVAVLDQLMGLVGELAQTRNQLLQHAGTEENPQIAAAFQRLSLLTSALQEGITQTRMQPVSQLWNKMPRIVHDLALGVGKRIRVEMEGSETTLDRSLVEALKAPLTHLVRNSVDHGIETPAARRAAGKPPEGVVRL